MKILICTNHSYMFWQFRRELTEALLKDNEVVLSTPFVGHEEDLQKMGCRMVPTDIDRRGINPVTDLKLFCFYKKLIKREKPDMVISYSIKPNIYAGLVCRMNRIAYCANVQGLGTAFQKRDLVQIVTALYKVALKKAKTTFFENEENARLFRELKIQKRDKQTVLHGAGVNLNYYMPQPYPQNEKPHFLYLGRIMREKGIDEIIDAIKELKTAGFDFVLDLVGFYEDEYQEKINALVADGVVAFHGFQTDPRPYYTNADCIVLPSYHEGMSNVLLEAAATGRPVITSDIPGCRETVVPNESGFLVPSRDANALCTAMRKMLEMSRQERETMGRKGVEHIRAEFDKKRVVSDTVQAIMSS